MKKIRKPIVVREFVYVDGGSNLVVMATDEDRGQEYTGHDPFCWLCVNGVPHSYDRHILAVGRREMPGSH